MREYSGEIDLQNCHETCGQVYELANNIQDLFIALFPLISEITAIVFTFMLLVSVVSRI